MPTPHPSIGNKAAFPSPENATEGMTYRQWLIGQALAGLLASGDDGRSTLPVEVADRLIDRLDGEAARAREESLAQAEAAREREEAEAPAAQPAVHPRIKAMMARQQACLERERAAREERKRVANAGLVLLGSLLEALRPCDDLWVRRNGQTGQVRTHISNGPPPSLYVTAVGMAGSPLLAFGVAGNVATGEVHLACGGVEFPTIAAAAEYAINVIDGHLYDESSWAAPVEQSDTPF